MTEGVDERLKELRKLEGAEIVEHGEDSIESSVDSDESNTLLGTEGASNAPNVVDADTRLSANEHAAARGPDPHPASLSKASSGERTPSHRQHSADVGADRGVDNSFGEINADPGISVADVPQPIPEGEPVPTVDPHIHELNAKLLFTSENYGAFGDEDISDLDDDAVIKRHNESALAPYWAIVSQWEPDDVMRDRYGTFEALGYEWEFVPRDAEKAGVTYWQGKIAARGQSFDAFNEYQIGVRTTDEIGARSASFQFRPALPAATHCDSGELIGGMPRDMPYGVRVQIGSSNLTPDETTELLRSVADVIGVNSDYFGEDRIHQWSRAFGLGQYVRLDREEAQKKLVGRGSALDRLARFASTMEGSSGEYEWDNEEVMGHRNALLLDSHAWSKLIPQDQFAKLLKYYHPKNPRSESTTADEDPLRDPKFEIQFSPTYNEEDSVPWQSDAVYDFRDLIEEAENALMNVLNWANVTTRADERTFTEDEYWTPTESVTDYVELVRDPMPRIEKIENAAALKQFADGASSLGERHVLQAVADGGSAMHWTDVREAAGQSKSTIYRAVKQFDDILKIQNGSIGFEDGIIRDRVDQLLGSFNDAMDWVRGEAGHLADKAARFAQATSALGRWARRHLAHIEETHDGLLVDLTGTPLLERELEEILRSGFNAAYDDGSHAARTFVEDTVFRWYSKEQERVRESKNIVLEEAGRVKICGNKRASFGVSRGSAPR
ncbi:hypothetical protein [Halobaculum marinum]|uniref:DUF7845 domain-containing protein n=1 Tax=Halobaculum marinum TaxID=3031996 RepID=A0ABD5WW20_9EURY|nr:hypothetical protein [Halobaculum sp. DT55]